MLPAKMCHIYDVCKICIICIMLVYFGDVAHMSILYTCLSQCGASLPVLFKNVSTKSRSCEQI